jgi:hypothetical protein
LAAEYAAIPAAMSADIFDIGIIAIIRDNDRGGRRFVL